MFCTLQVNGINEPLESYQRRIMTDLTIFWKPESPEAGALGTYLAGMKFTQVRETIYGVQGLLQECF
jgi:hypothetical protein